MTGAIALGYTLPASWLHDRIEARRRAVFRELPFYLDVLTLSVEAGLNITSAFNQAVEKGPRGPLRHEFDHMLQDLRAGRSREQALRAVAERLQVPAVGSLVAALLVAEKQGASLGVVLRAQAE
ncbi:MAG: type II secretion system F family protein, partial [Quisquiliibacterium sp.]